jgi:chromosome segregation ATPase
MSTNDEIAQRLTHFGSNIQKWRDEAARLTLLATQSRQRPASKSELTALEETASAIYADISAFKATVDEVTARSPAAASELAAASDALHLVLLEITELGIRLYSVHSGMPQASVAGPAV